jgi:putative membrane protein
VRFFVRWLISAIALFVAAKTVTGIEIGAGAMPVFTGVAVVLGLVNALIRPLFRWFSCGYVIPALALFSLVINGLGLWFASVVAVNWFSAEFLVHDFWAAVLAAAMVSFVTVILSWPIEDNRPTRY